MEDDVTRPLVGTGVDFATFDASQVLERGDDAETIQDKLSDQIDLNRERLTEEQAGLAKAAGILTSAFFASRLDLPPGGMETVVDVAAITVMGISAMFASLSLRELKTRGDMIKALRTIAMYEGRKKG